MNAEYVREIEQDERTSHPGTEWVVADAQTGRGNLYFRTKKEADDSLARHIESDQD